MPNTDTLLALAEICAAFAGFAALVSVLGRRNDRLAAPGPPIANAASLGAEPTKITAEVATPPS